MFEVGLGNADRHNEAVRIFDAGSVSKNEIEKLADAGGDDSDAKAERENSDNSEGRGLGQHAAGVGELLAHFGEILGEQADEAKDTVLGPDVIDCVFAKLKDVGAIDDLEFVREGIGQPPVDAKCKPFHEWASARFVSRIRTSSWRRALSAS